MRRLRSIRTRGLATLLLLLGSAGAGAAQDRTPSRVFGDDWSQGKSRLFAAFGASAGSLARTDLTVGYGKPHWTWVGVEADGQTTADMAMTRVRARLALVVADLAVGWGRVWSYKHTTLPEQASYASLTYADRPEAHYRTLQLWLMGLLPAPHGYLDWQLEALRIYGGSVERAVYDEQLRAVVFAPWALAGRLGYAFQFADKKGAIGVLAEGLWPGERDDYLARIGPMFSWMISPRLDVGGVVTMTVHSPDRLNVYEHLWGSLRVRYRTATR